MLIKLRENLHLRANSPRNLSKWLWLRSFEYKRVKRLLQVFKKESGCRNSI